jgi:hypothetical protein
MAKGALSSTCTTVLMQTSSQIFKVWNTARKCWTPLMSVLTIGSDLEPVQSSPN